MSGETVDSDAKEVTVPARPDAPSVTGEAATAYQGKGKLKGTTAEMEYKPETSENGQWTDCTADMEVAPGSYIVRIRATETAFASAPTDKIIVGDYTMTTETTPNIGIDYETEKLTGFIAGASYSVKAGDAEATVITPETTEIAIAADYFGKTLTIVKKGTGNISNDSAGFGLSILARPTAPTANEITVTQPQTYGAKGKIEGITAAMEYSADNGANWADSDGNAIENIEPDTTYKIRYKATNTSFKSEEYSVTIIAHGADPENTPNFTVNYANEKLEQSGANGNYIITVDSAENTVSAVDGKIAVRSEWIGKAISIVKKGNGTSTTNSKPQSLTLGGRADKPTGLVGEAPTSSSAQGKIKGTTADMQYKSTAEDSAWNDCLATETAVNAGTYVVRTKATDDKFASETVEVTVSEFVKSAWAIPAISIDYANEKLTGFDEDGSYTVKIGENGEATQITLTDNKLDVADYMGKTIYIVRTGDADHTNSAAKTLTVPARPKITATAIKIDNAKEGVTVPTGYFYGIQDGYENITEAGAGTLVKVEPEGTIYIYKPAVTEGTKAFKSEIKTLTAPARNVISSVEISFADETINTTANMQYSTDDGETWESCTDTMNVTAFGWTGTAAKTVKFRVPANESNYTSDVVLFEIKKRPAAPKKDVNFTVSQPQEIGATGSISVVAPETMEYSTNGTQWVEVESATMENLAVNSKHYFRFKATESDFKSAASTVVTITAFGAQKENTPEFEIDFATETLKETDASGDYTVTVGETAYECNDINSSIAINDDWFGKTIQIVKNGNGHTTDESEPQEVEIKARPQAPTITVTQPGEINGKGKLTGMTGKQYKTSTATEWTNAENDEIEVVAGTYRVRTAATATEFASAVKTVTVAAFVPGQKDAPTLGVDYAAEELTGFEDGESYTIDGADVEITNGKLSLVSYIGSEDRTLEIVTKGDNTKLDSDKLEFTINARPASPQVTGGNGKITGTTVLMEYKKSDASSWTVCTDNETEVEAGEYNVRIAVTATDFASVSATVTVTEAFIDPPVPQPVSIPAIGQYAGKVNISRLTNEAGKEIFAVEPDASISADFAITLYVAEYDNVGRLTSLKLGTADKSADGKITITSERPSSAKFKFMLWDSELCPLIEVIDNLD